MNRIWTMWMIVGVFVLAGCKAKIESLEFTSPDGKAVVKVTGTQKAPMDPIDVVVDLSTPGAKATVNTTFQAGSMTKENVRVDWDGRLGTLVFTMDDGDEKKVELVMFDDQIKTLILPPANGFPH